MMKNPEKAAGGVVGAALLLAIIGVVSATQDDGKPDKTKQSQTQAGATTEPKTGETSSAPEAAQSGTTGSGSIAGKDLVGDDGLPIGQVESVVRDRKTGTKYAVVSVGGFLGAWTKEVTVPLSDLTKQDGALAAKGIDDAEQLYARAAYR